MSEQDYLSENKSESLNQNEKDSFNDSEEEQDNSEHSNYNLDFCELLQKLNNGLIKFYK